MLLGSSSVFANGFLTTGIGNASIDGADDTTSYSVGAGMPLTERLAGELRYIFAPAFEVDGTRIDADATIMAAGLLLKLPLQNSPMNIYGRLGMHQWEVEAGFGNEDGTDAYYGLGIGTPIHDRLELQLHYTVFRTDDDDMDVLGLGLRYRIP